MKTKKTACPHISETDFFKVIFKTSLFWFVLSLLMKMIMTNGDQDDGCFIFINSMMIFKTIRMLKMCMTDPIYHNKQLHPQESGHPLAGEL